MSICKGAKGNSQQKSMLRGFSVCIWVDTSWVVGRVKDLVTVDKSNSLRNTDEWVSLSSCPRVLDVMFDCSLFFGWVVLCVCWLLEVCKRTSDLFTRCSQRKLSAEDLGTRVYFESAHSQPRQIDQI